MLEMQLVSCVRIKSKILVPWVGKMTFWNKLELAIKSVNTPSLNVFDDNEVQSIFGKLKSPEIDNQRRKD